jgi:site-specific recombinase XerD
MNYSNKPIIKHIPDFLDYCEIEKGLSDNTQKNYSRYLKKFTDWLLLTEKKRFTPSSINSRNCLGLPIVSCEI